MVVNHLGHLTADDLADAFHDPFPAGVGVPASELHRRDETPEMLTCFS